MRYERLLGIDPGLERVGYGLIELSAGQTPRALDWGIIQTLKGREDAERLLEIHRDLTALLQEYGPCTACVERIYFFKNAKTLVPVSQARGVVLLALAQAGVAIAEYTPMQVKQSLTGYGKADKAEMQRMVQHTLYLDVLPTPDDAADALALALCHVRMRAPSLV